MEESETIIYDRALCKNASALVRRIKKINRRRARKLNHPAWRMFSCTVICSANVDKRRRADKKGRANSVTNKIARQLSAGRKKRGEIE